MKKVRMFFIRYDGRLLSIGVLMSVIGILLIKFTDLYILSNIIIGTSLNLLIAVSLVCNRLVKKNPYYRIQAIPLLIFWEVYFFYMLFAQKGSTSQYLDKIMTYYLILISGLTGLSLIYGLINVSKPIGK